MKKLFTVLFFVVITTNVFSQQPCQASFTYNYNPVGGTLNLYDNSYNLDSTQLNVTSWYWSVQYGGVTYTYNMQNPVITINGYSGPITVCLQIGSLLCQSVYCDTVYINSNPPDSCVASFTYQVDSVGYIYSFFDASATNSGSINSWSWVITDQNQTILSTSNIQNPVFTFPGNGIYYVCLTINSDSGCQQTTCEYVYVQDSNSSNCQLNISANIGHVSVPGGNDGYIELTVTGGTQPYTYNWLNLGLNTQNIYNLSSGVYIVNITSADTTCPAVTFTAQVVEPFDSTNIIIDTLYTNVIDTCFSYVVDSFYIDSIYISGTNMVTVVWILSGGGMNTPVYATYTYIMNGAQIVVLTINCDSGQKDLTTYMGYIYISPTAGIEGNSQQQFMNLFPNPVNDLLNIDFGDFLPEQSTIRIYSGSGQEVYSRTLTDKTKIITIDVSHLIKGIYFIRTDDNKNNIITGKFIK